MTIIVADLGATNARLAFIKRGRLSDLYQFACDDFKNPYLLIESFMHAYAPDAKYVLVGVPGPVLKDEVKWTNRNWKLNAKLLKQKLKVKQAVLMNDLQVQGYALNNLNRKDLVFLQGTKLGTGPKVLVNIGTGLGSSYIIDGKVYSAEYGQSLLNEKSSIESRISGPGFKKLYQQLTNAPEVISAVKIAEKCLAGDRLAKETYKLFYAEFSRVLMNLALTIKATGGVYFCGGILDEKTLKQLKFAQSFSNHPKMATLLKNMPLIFIKKKDFAFLGLKTLAKKFGWS